MIKVSIKSGYCTTRSDIVLENIENIWQWTVVLIVKYHWKHFHMLNRINNISHEEIHNPVSFIISPKCIQCNFWGGHRWEHGYGVLSLWHAHHYKEHNTTLLNLNLALQHNSSSSATFISAQKTLWCFAKTLNVQNQETLLH